MPVSNATSRFSDRVENYVRYRPGYPPGALQVLKDDCGLAPDHVIADLASGTGIWTRILLENRNPVFGIEPNAEMRLAGERLLAGFPKFTSVAGTAEATTLPDHTVDFVTAAQAAHWFHRERARSEFLRILKPGGWLVLLWNERLTDANAFLREYEQLLLIYGTDYEDVRHERTTEEMNEFLTLLRFKSVSSRCGRSLTIKALRAGFCLPHLRRDPGIRIKRRCCASYEVYSTHTTLL